MLWKNAADAAETQHSVQKTYTVAEAAAPAPAFDEEWEDMVNSWLIKLKDTLPGISCPELIVQFAARTS